MKVKIKELVRRLPNCWKQCGVSSEDWDKLKAGETIEVKTLVYAIKSLVNVVDDSSSKKTKKLKGDK